MVEAYGNNSKLFGFPPRALYNLFSSFPAIQPHLWGIFHKCLLSYLCQLKSSPKSSLFILDQCRPTSSLFVLFSLQYIVLCLCLSPKMTIILKIRAGTMPFTSVSSTAMNIKQCQVNGRHSISVSFVIWKLYKWFLHRTRAGREPGKTRHCSYAKWKLNYMSLFLYCYLCHFLNTKIKSPNTIICQSFKNPAR